MNGAQCLRNAIKTTGYNAGDRIEFGTVTAASPNFSVKIDGMNIELDADDFIVTGRLIETGLNVNDRVLITVKENGKVFVIIDKIGKFE